MVHSNKKSLSVFASGLLCAAVLGCGGTQRPAETPPPPGCTEVGCTDGLTVEIQTTQWKAGLYKFVVVTDNKTTTCVGQLPLKRCEDGQSLQCDGSNVRIVESGCALEPASHGFGDIAVDGEPSHVTIKVERDAEPIGSLDATPSYKTVEPNGPKCSPRCRRGALKLQIPTDSSVQEQSPT